MKIPRYSYFNPFSSSFHAVQEFQKIPRWQKKAAIVAVTCFGTILTLGIGTVAIFRVMTHRMNPTKTDEKTGAVALPSLAPPTDKIPSKPIAPHMSPPIATAKKEEKQVPLIQPSLPKPQPPKKGFETPKLSAPSQTLKAPSAQLSFQEELERLEANEEAVLGWNLSEEGYVLEYTTPGQNVLQYEFDEAPAFSPIHPLQAAKERGSVSSMSKETRLAISKLDSFLESKKLKKGEANDTGDCFYHSIAQTLAIELKMPFTISDIRKAVYDYVSDFNSKFLRTLSAQLGKEISNKELSKLIDTFYRHPESLSKGVRKALSDNWILTTKREDYQDFIEGVLFSEEALISSYNEWVAKKGPALNELIIQANKLKAHIRELIDTFNAEDSTIEFDDLCVAAEEYRALHDRIVRERKVAPIPYWGDLYVDGRILSEHYNVDIVAYSATSSSVLERKKPSELEHPQATVIIGQYQNHFVPIYTGS